MHLSAERGLDYDEVRQLNPAVATRNGLLKAGDVLKLPKEKGSSAAKRAADAVDDTTTASEPSTAPPATADDTNAPVVGEDITPADAPRGDSRDAPADDTTGPVHPGTARASHDGDDDAGSAMEERGSSRTPPPPSSTPGMPPASPDDRADPSLDEVREDMRRRGVSAVRGIGGVVGAVVKTAGASVGAVREAAAASSAVLRESSEDLRRTSDWVNSEVTGIATKAGEEIENLRRSRPAGTKDSSLDSSDSPVTLDASDSPAVVSTTPPDAVSKTPPTPPSSPARPTLAERVEARAERRRAAEAESSARREKSKSVADAVRGKLTEAGQLVHKMRQDEGTEPVHDDANNNRRESEGCGRGGCAREARRGDG